MLLQQPQQPQYPSYPQQQQPMMSYSQPVGSAPPMAPQPQTIHVNGLFDAGCRFDTGAQPRIPVSTCSFFQLV